MSEGTQTTTTAPNANVLAVPLNEDGTIGPLPEQLQKLVDKSIREAVNRAKAKGDPSPVEAEELRQARARLAEFEQAEAIRKGEFDKALQMREAAYNEDKAKLQAELERRTARLKEASKADIRAAAASLGARPESLDELESILSTRVALDDETLQARVVGEDGKPSEQTIPQLVEAYLKAKPHHVAAPTPGGGSRGGASLTGNLTGGGQAAVEAALDAWMKNPTAKNYQDVQAAKAALGR